MQTSTEKCLKLYATNILHNKYFTICIIFDIAYNAVIDNMRASLGFHDVIHGHKITQCHVCKQIKDEVNCMIALHKLTTATKDFINNNRRYLLYNLINLENQIQNCNIGTSSSDHHQYYEMQMQ